MQPLNVHFHRQSSGARQGEPSRTLVICDIPLVASRLSELATAGSGAEPCCVSSWSEARQVLEAARFKVVLVCVLGSVTRELLSLDKLYRPEQWLVLPMRSSESLGVHAQRNRRLSLIALASEPGAITSKISMLSGASAQHTSPDASISAISPALTRHEHNLLRLLSDGLSTREIASRLNITTGTVRNTLSRVYRKLGVANRTAAALTYRALFLDS